MLTFQQNGFTELVLRKSAQVRHVCRVVLVDTGTFSDSIDILISTGRSVYLIFSFGGKKKVCILSKNYEKVRDFILNDINRGATLYEAKGAKEGEMRWEINTIVDKSEYRRIISYLQKNDPSAFVTVYSVSEVLDNSKRVPKSEK